MHNKKLLGGGGERFVGIGYTHCVHKAVCHAGRGGRGSNLLQIDEVAVGKLRVPK